MERTIFKPIAGVAALIIAFILAFAFAPQARAEMQASKLQAGELSSQATGANISKDRAYKLAFGATVTGKFKYKQGSHSTLNEYWFKFKTTKRNSIYVLTVKSPDGRPFFLVRQDAQGNDARDYWTTLEADSPTSVTTINKSYAECWKKNSWNLKKGTWQYICLAPRNDSSVNTRYSINVKEYQPIEMATGVKATNVKATSATLKWKSQVNATKYQVKYRAKGGKWVYKTVTKNTLALKKLKKNTKYQVRVRAFNANGWDFDESKPTKWAGWSDVVSFKTAKQ